MTTKTPTEQTGARTDEAASLIGDARTRIDALDDRIIGLIQERMAVSAVIQEARISSGGRRVNLAREMEVLAHIAAGDSNKLIARALDLSPHTVKRHVANILDKLDVSTRGQAAAWYQSQAH